jgi:hypothetical protein
VVVPSDNHSIVERAEIVSDSWHSLVNDVIAVNFELIFIGFAALQNDFYEALFTVSERVMLTCHGQLVFPVIPTSQYLHIISNQLCGQFDDFFLGDGVFVNINALLIQSFWVNLN